MAKVKSTFECMACGYQSPKWMGKCPNCGAWNQMEEVIEHKQ
ncbi:helicase DnaB, partial [Staphylococcus aureus]